MYSSKELNTKSSSTSSAETDSESEQEKPKDSEISKPQSLEAHAKEAKLKGKKFLRKQYIKFGLISLAKPKKKNPQAKEEQITTKSGRVIRKPEKYE